VRALAEGFNTMRRLLISAALTVCVVGSGCGSKSQSLPSPPGSETGKAQSTLSMEAGLVYRSGDVKPVARNEFYLLDDDAEKILRDAGIKKKGRLTHWKEVSFVNSYAAAKLCVSRVTRCPALKDSWDFARDADNALRPHIAKSVTTGFDGKAGFEPVPAGTYYVMGVYLREDSFVSWNVKVDLKSEAEQVILDQNNSSMIFQPGFG
jgi:hypothetical protein